MRTWLTNVLCFLEEITKWIDEGSSVNIICSENFRQSATSKITTYIKCPWYRGWPNRLDREQWLTDRRECVVVDGEVSNWKSVLSGAPKGSVLGHLVFLIYIYIYIYIYISMTWTFIIYSESF